MSFVLKITIFLFTINVQYTQLLKLLEMQNNKKKLFHFVESKQEETKNAAS